MSKDKHRNRDRRVRLLRSLAEGKHLALHCIGGWGMREPIIKRLLRDGHIEIRRGRAFDHKARPKWSRDFREWIARGHMHGDVNRTRAFITPAGRSFLASQDHSHAK